MRKPDNIVYWIDDVPPARFAFGLAVQQVAFLGAVLAVPSVFAQNLGLTPDQFLDLAGATLLYSAVLVLLNSLKRGPIGAGLFLPVQGTTAVFPALVLAAATPGGLADSFGMVAVIGVTQIAASLLIPRMRGIVTVEVAGLAVLLIGSGIGMLGLDMIFDPHPVDGGVRPEELTVSAVTFVTMVVLNVWVKNKLKLFAPLIGLIAGGLTALALGVVDSAIQQAILDEPLIRLPQLGRFGWGWSTEALLPAILTGLSLALVSMGVQTVAQRFNDADWRKPELDRIGNGVRAEGVAQFAAALFNGLPMAASGGAASLALASGCTSRHLAYWVAGLLVLFACLPKLIVAWVLLPQAVLGALFLFLSAFATLSGIQLIGGRMLDTRRTIAIGVGFLVGFAYEQIHGAVDHAAPVLHGVIFSAFASALATTIVLSAFFRLGTKSYHHRTFPIEDTHLDEMERFMEQQGRRWGAHKDVVRRARNGTWHAFELLSHHGLLADAHPQIAVDTLFDEFRFVVTLSYRGAAPPLTDRPPTAEEMLAEEDAPTRLTGHLLTKMADEVKLRSTGDRHELRLTFND